MTGHDEIAEVFTIFHDGWISSGTTVGSDADIVLEIQYLAERIQLAYRTFTVRLECIETIRFFPWLDAGSTTVSCMANFWEIFGLELGVLNAEVVDSTVRVACNQDQQDRGYRGGFLEISAAGCRVFDEGKDEWTLPGLRSLAASYWDNWAARGKQEQQAAAGQFVSPEQPGGWTLLPS